MSPQSRYIILKIVPKSIHPVCESSRDDLRVLLHNEPKFNQWFILATANYFLNNHSIILCRLKIKIAVLSYATHLPLSENFNIFYPLAISLQLLQVLFVSQRSLVLSSDSGISTAIPLWAKVWSAMVIMSEQNTKSERSYSPKPRLHEWMEGIWFFSLEGFQS